MGTSCGSVTRQSPSFVFFFVGTTQKHKFWALDRPNEPSVYEPVGVALTSPGLAAREALRQHDDLKPVPRSGVAGVWVDRPSGPRSVRGQSRDRGNDHRNGERGLPWGTGGANVIEQAKGGEQVATGGSDHLYVAAVACGRTACQAVDRGQSARTAWMKPSASSDARGQGKGSDYSSPSARNDACFA